MTIVANSQTIDHIITLLKEKMKDGGEYNHKWNSDIESKDIVYKVKTSGHGGSYYSSVEIEKKENLDISGTQILAIVNFEGTYGFDTTRPALLIYEGDKILEVNSEEVLVEQRSAAILDILGKQSVVTLYSK